MAESASSVVSVRVSAEERDLLEAAARQVRINLSEFVRRKAIAGAEAELLGRSSVVIPAEDWASFEAWLHRPAEPNESLQRLSRPTPTWSR